MSYDYREEQRAALWDELRRATTEQDARFIIKERQELVRQTSQSDLQLRHCNAACEAAWEWVHSTEFDIYLYQRGAAS